MNPLRFKRFLGDSMKNVKKDLSVIGIEKMSAQETWFNELLKENPKFIKGKYEPIDFDGTVIQSSNRCNL